jgi:hypothetical protein
MLYLVLILLLPALFGIGFGVAELVRRSGFKGFIFGLEFHKPQEVNESSKTLPIGTTDNNSRSLLRSRHD